jgi:hypothetical protein
MYTTSGHTLLEMLLGCVDHLERDDFEATLLEAGDDLADEGALDAVGLDHDVRTLVVSHSAHMKSAIRYATRRVKGTHLNIGGGGRKSSRGRARGGWGCLGERKKKTSRKVRMETIKSRRFICGKWSRALPIGTAPIDAIAIWICINLLALSSKRNWTSTQEDGSKSCGIYIRLAYELYRNKGGTRPYFAGARLSPASLYARFNRSPLIV